MSTNINKTKEIVDKFVARLPESEVDGVIAYGSGVKKQGSAPKRKKIINIKNQVDTMILVPHEELFHRFNFLMNPDMYSMIGSWFFLKHPEWYHYGSDTCYIPYIDPEEGFRLTVEDYVKAGIISTENFISNNYTWDKPYNSFRVQKPVDADVNEAAAESIDYTRLSGLIAALMMVDRNNTDVNGLLTKICSLSYLGDTRSFIEGDDKIRGIVQGSYDEFLQIYKPDNLHDGLYKVRADSLIVPDYDAIDEYGLENLPSSLVNFIEPEKKLAHMSKEELEKLREQLISFFIEKNSGSSLQMTIKGLATAGAVKSLRYVGAKVYKSIERKLTSEKGPRLTLTNDNQEQK